MSLSQENKHTKQNKTKVTTQFIVFFSTFIRQ